MRILIGLLLAILCLGCQKENHPKIEIYLLKHTVESDEGIPYVDSKEYKLDKNKTYDSSWLETARYDTIYKRTLWGGSFKVASKDLEDYPFIKDDEIINFDPKKDILIFNSSVMERVEKIGRSKAQFVITIDGKPMLCGYFWNCMVSSLPQSFYIYDCDNYGFKDNKNEKSYMIEFGNAKFRKVAPEKLRPSYSQELIEAFRLSGRLIE